MEEAERRKTIEELTRSYEAELRAGGQRGIELFEWLMTTYVGTDEVFGAEMRERFLPMLPQGDGWIVASRSIKRNLGKS